MLVFLCGAILGQGPLFSKVFPNPTGTNGYEEYVRAAEMVSGHEFGVYRGWVSVTSFFPTQSSETDRPSDVEEKDSNLTVRRKWADRYRVCCNLISSGNRKPAHDPRDQVSRETLYPELSEFKALAILEANTAHVAFADGQIGDAVNHLKESLLFSSRVGGLGLISRLVGVACDSIALAELDDHWAQLSVIDAHELKRYFAGRLTAPSLMADSVKGERRLMKSSLDSFFTKPSSFSGEGSTGAADAVAKLSPEDALKVRADAEVAIQAYCDSVVALLGGPESNWLSFRDPSEEDASLPLAGQVVGLIEPVMSQAILAEARDRTQMRLAYLTASAIEYRWQMGRLPARLDEFADRSERLDPTSGRSFIYRRDGPWFRITREGKDALGTVGVRRRPGDSTPDTGPAEP